MVSFVAMTSLTFSQDEEEIAEISEALQREQAEALAKIAQMNEDYKNGKAPAIDIEAMLVPYRQLSPEQTKNELAEKLKGKPVVDNPKLINFLDALFRDKKALPDIVQILNEREKLAYFLGINIVILIMAIMLKRRHYRNNPDGSILGNMTRGLRRFVLITGLRLSTLYFFFGANFARSWELVQSHFL